MADWRPRGTLWIGLGLAAWSSLTACGDDGSGGGSSGGATSGGAAGTGAAGASGGGSGSTGAQGGSGGTGGTSGVGGVAGTGNAGGSSGAAGSGGSSGAAGASGSAGMAGAGGAAGSDGSAGASGAAGSGGSSGSDAGADVSLGGTAGASDAGADAPDVSVDAQDAGCTDASQCPAPSDVCSVASCMNGVCGTTAASAGTACDAGVCNGAGSCGACVPNATECQSGQLVTCTSTGQWGTPQACPFVCSNGACTGVCVPGAQRCNGSAVETCDANGQWQTSTQCTGSTPSCEDAKCEPPTPPSCQSLAKTCGLTGTRYCCATSATPGGTFKRSYDGVSFTDPGYPATLSSFRIDAYEVTVGRFRAFVDAGKGTKSTAPAAGDGAHPSITGSGWQSTWNTGLQASTSSLKTALACNASYATWTDSPGPNEAQPINCVTWYEAFAFCAWDGARLATEAEWNYAASGGDEQRVLPWSAPPTSTTASSSEASYYVDGTLQCMGDGIAGCTLADLVRVGTKPLGASRWGAQELAGNVWEWVLDVYSNPYSIVSCTDCAVLSGSSNRVIRGGSFFGSPATIRAANRSISLPDQRLFSVGIRCAR